MMNILTNFKGFLDDLLIEFPCFLLSVVRDLAMHKASFCMGVLLSVDLLTQSKKQRGFVVKMLCVLREGCRQHFFVNF